MVCNHYGTILAFRHSMLPILTFYRNFLWPVMCFNLIGCYAIWASGTWTYIVVVFWIKVFVNASLGGFVHLFHSNQYQFFHNLGFTKLQLYGYTFTLDFAVWLFLSYLTIKLML